LEEVAPGRCGWKRNHTSCSWVRFRFDARVWQPHSCVQHREGDLQYKCSGSLSESASRGTTANTATAIAATAISATAIDATAIDATAIDATAIDATPIDAFVATVATDDL
jgi:hypothetical protein